MVGFAGGLFADYDRIGQVLEIHRIQDGRGECASPDDDIGFYAGVLFQEPGQPFDECRPLCRVPSAVVPHVENDLPDGVALQYAERLLAEFRERRQRRGFLAALELRLAFTPPAGVVEDIVYFFLGEIAIREKHVPFRDRKGQGIGLEGGPTRPLRIGRFERIGLVSVQREFRLPVVCEPEIFQEL